jgi:hypothetical protein
MMLKNHTHTHTWHGYGTAPLSLCPISDDVVFKCPPFCIWHEVWNIQFNNSEKIYNVRIHKMFSKSHQFWQLYHNSVETNHQQNNTYFVNLRTYFSQSCLYWIFFLSCLGKFWKIKSPESCSQKDKNFTCWLKIILKYKIQIYWK